MKYMFNKKEKIVEIKRRATFLGKRKVGLDTNILIKLYDNPYLFSYEESRIFDMGVVFIHAISQWEFIKYIMNKKGLDEENAKLEAKSFLEKRKIKILYPKGCFITKEETDSFENDLNKKFKEIGKDYLECHKPDSIILLAFKKYGVNKVISTDEVFREGAKFLGINSSGLPSLDYTISRELKKIFDYKKKRQRKHKRN